MWKRFHDGEIFPALSCVELISENLSIRMCFDTKKDMHMPDLLDTSQASPHATANGER